MCFGEQCVFVEMSAEKQKKCLLRKSEKAMDCKRNKQEVKKSKQEVRYKEIQATPGKKCGNVIVLFNVVLRTVIRVSPRTSVVRTWAI